MLLFSKIILYLYNELDLGLSIQAFEDKTRIREAYYNYLQVQCNAWSDKRIFTANKIFLSYASSLFHYFVIPNTCQRHYVHSTDQVLRLLTKSDEERAVQTRTGIYENNFVGNLTAIKTVGGSYFIVKHQVNFKMRCQLIQCQWKHRATAGVTVLEQQYNVKKPAAIQLALTTGTCARKTFLLHKDRIGIILGCVFVSLSNRAVLQTPLRLLLIQSGPVNKS